MNRLSRNRYVKQAIIGTVSLGSVYTGYRFLSDNGKQLTLIHKSSTLSHHHNNNEQNHHHNPNGNEKESTLVRGTGIIGRMNQTVGVYGHDDESMIQQYNRGNELKSDVQFHSMYAHRNLLSFHQNDHHHHTTSNNNNNNNDNNNNKSHSSDPSSLSSYMSGMSMSDDDVDNGIMGMVFELEEVIHTMDSNHHKKQSHDFLSSSSSTSNTTTMTIDNDSDSNKYQMRSQWVIMRPTCAIQVQSSLNDNHHHQYSYSSSIGHVSSSSDMNEKSKYHYHPHMSNVFQLDVDRKCYVEYPEPSHNDNNSSSALNRNSIYTKIVRNEFDYVPPQNKRQLLEMLVQNGKITCPSHWTMNDLMHNVRAHVIQRSSTRPLPAGHPIRITEAFINMGDQVFVVGDLVMPSSSVSSLNEEPSSGGVDVFQEIHHGNISNERPLIRSKLLVNGKSEEEYTSELKRELWFDTNRALALGTLALVLVGRFI